MLRRLRYVIAVLSVYPILQGAAALYLYWEFSKVPNLETAPRMPNVRLLSAATLPAAVRSFVSNTATGERDVVLLAGDSQFYGYFLAATDTVVRYLQEELRDTQVINASMIGAETRYPLIALKNTLAAGITPRVVVVAVNPSSAASRDMRETDPKFLPLPMALFFAHESGELLVDLAKKAIRAKRWEFDLHYAKSAPPGDGTYQVAALKPTYYRPELSAIAEANLRDFLQWSDGKVPKLILVASPHHYQPYLAPPYSYKWDTGPVMRKYISICREFAHVVCLDLASEFGRERFHDIIHLNKGGHQEMARRLAAEIRR